jgi:carbon starvation protein
VTAVPAVWLLICTTYAGFIKIFDSNPAQGFLAQAHKFQAALASDTITAPAKSVAQMKQIVVNAYVNTGLTALFLLVVARCWCIRSRPSWRPAATRSAATARPRTWR